MELYDKVYGALLSAAVGDAMGAATEARTTAQIEKVFGHRVETFEKPPADAIGAGNEAGQLTDDFSCAYFLAKHIIDHKGQITREIVEQAIVDWSEHDVFYTRFVGPSTRRAVARFKGMPYTESTDFVNYPAWATNGSAMRISPVGLFNPGNIDQAVEDAVTVTLTTHVNHLSVSGACAVAAAVSCGLRENADLYDVIHAGLYGAQQGEKIGRKVGTVVPGASVVRRMEEAVRIGNSSLNTEEKVNRIRGCIGTGLHIAEAVPAAFGLLTTFQADPMATIIAGVNIGYDTDTVSTIAGGICGALMGSTSIPQGYGEVIDRMNDMDLHVLATGILETNRLYRNGG